MAATPDSVEGPQEQHAANHPRCVTHDRRTSCLAGDRLEPVATMGRPYNFIATASVVVGSPTLWQNVAKRGSSR
jgi:hypothetical protein